MLREVYLKSGSSGQVAVLQIVC